MTRRRQRILQAGFISSKNTSDDVKPLRGIALRRKGRVVGGDPSQAKNPASRIHIIENTSDDVKPLRGIALRRRGRVVEGDPSQAKNPASRIHIIEKYFR